MRTMFATCRSFVGPLVCATLLAVSLTSEARQQQPQIGIAPVPVGDGPFVYDTAEQHRLRVVVVARGLVRPFSLAFLPNGDALVTARGTRLRLIRNATGAATLEPEPVDGIPQQPAFRTGGAARGGAAPAVCHEPPGLLHLQQGRRTRPPTSSTSCAANRCSASCTSGFATSRQGPDGLLYVITDEDDGVLPRLEPASGS